MRKKISNRCRSNTSEAENGRLAAAVQVSVRSGTGPFAFFKGRELLQAELPPAQPLLSAAFVLATWQAEHPHRQHFLPPHP